MAIWLDVLHICEDDLKHRHFGFDAQGLATSLIKQLYAKKIER
jgi:hypothetical protein